MNPQPNPEAQAIANLVALLTQRQLQEICLRSIRLIKGVNAALYCVHAGRAEEDKREGPDTARHGVIACVIAGDFTDADMARAVNFLRGLGQDVGEGSGYISGKEINPIKTLNLDLNATEDPT